MSWTFSQQWKKADLYNKDTHLDSTTSVHTYLAASQEYRHHCYVLAVSTPSLIYDHQTSSITYKSYKYKLQ